MKRLLHFDDEGFYVAEELVSSSYLKSKSNEYIAELNEEIAFHRPRLIDGELVEGKTEDAFFEEQSISSLLPNAEELEKAEFEIKILTLLSEMEVI